MKNMDMNKQLVSLWSNKFIHNVIILMSGTAISQALLILISPILSRLYSPETFGVFALYSSLVGIISTVACWRYELAIVLPNDDNDAVSLLKLCGIIVVIMSGIAAFIIALWGKQIATLLGSPELQSWLWWVPISILMVGFYNALNYWSTRRKHFKRLSISQVIRSGGVAATQIGSGLANLGSSGLIGGQVVGQVIATLVLGIQIFRDDLKFVKQLLRPAKLKTLAKKYKNFPYYSSPQTFLNSLSQNLSPFLLAFYFSPEIVGLYAIAVKVLQLPVGLISQSVRNVYYQKASEDYNNGKSLYPLVAKTTLGLCALGILPVLFIIFWGPWLFSFVLGSEWYSAGVYARWMVIWIFFSFINPPSVMTMQVLMLQKVSLTIDVFLLILRAFALIIGGIYYNPLVTIALYSLVGAFVNFFIILFVMVVSKKAVRV